MYVLMQLLLVDFGRSGWILGIMIRPCNVSLECPSCIASQNSALYLQNSIAHMVPGSIAQMFAFLTMINQNKHFCLFFIWKNRSKKDEKYPRLKIRIGIWFFVFFIFKTVLTRYQVWGFLLVKFSFLWVKSRWGIVKSCVTL